HRAGRRAWREKWPRTRRSSRGDEGAGGGSRDGRGRGRRAIRCGHARARGRASRRGSWGDEDDEKQGGDGGQRRPIRELRDPTVGARDRSEERDERSDEPGRAPAGEERYRVGVEREYGMAGLLRELDDRINEERDGRAEP